MISKKVISNLYVLSFTMLICILCHMNGASIIKKYFDMIIMQIIIKESMFHLKDLCTTSPGRNILRLSGREGYKILFLGKQQNKAIFLKLTSSTSALPIQSTTDIVGIRKTHH